MKAMTTTLLLAAVLSTTPASADDLAATLDRYFEARGGRHALAAVATYRATGLMILDAANHNGIEIQAPFTLEWKAPDRVRFDFSLQGAPSTQATDGEVAWSSVGALRGGAPERMPEDRQQGLRDYADLVVGPFLDLAARGITLSLTGKEELQGTPVQLLRVERRDGRVATFVLDEETALPIELRSRSREGGPVRTRRLSDYKEVDGLYFPHFVEVANDVGKVLQTLRIDRIEVGVDLPDERFAMPGTQGETE